MKIIMFTCVFILAGCAGNVQDNVHDSKYGPTHQNKELSVSYLNQGINRVRDARREDAYKTMYKKCGGDYSIVREENTQGNNRFIESPADLAGNDQATYRKIIFECN